MMPESRQAQQLLATRETLTPTLPYSRGSILPRPALLCSLPSCSIVVDVAGLRVNLRSEAQESQVTIFAHSLGVGRRLPGEVVRRAPGGSARPCDSALDLIPEMIRFGVGCIRYSGVGRVQSERMARATMGSSRLTR